MWPRSYNFLWQVSPRELFVQWDSAMCAAFELSWSRAAGNAFFYRAASFCCRCRKWAFCPDIDQHPSMYRFDLELRCERIEGRTASASLSSWCWCDIELRQDVFNFLFDCNLWFSRTFIGAVTQTSHYRGEKWKLFCLPALSDISIYCFCMGLVAHAELWMLNGRCAPWTERNRQDLPAGFNQQSQSSTRGCDQDDDSLGTLVTLRFKCYERM